MLIGLDPLLGPDLLQALRAMGHGDTIVLADANFPSQSLARRLIRADGSDLLSLLTAVLSVLPIDQTCGPLRIQKEGVTAGRPQPSSNTAG
jgi:L-fucose mutarotase